MAIEHVQRRATKLLTYYLTYLAWTFSQITVFCLSSLEGKF